MNGERSGAPIARARDTVTAARTDSHLLGPRTIPT